MNLFEQLRPWLSTIRSRSDNATVDLKFDSTGLTQTSKSGNQIRLNWDEITSVYAYKRDCFTVDQIRLLIANDDMRLYVEVTEDDSCFHGLISNLPCYLPGCPSIDHWFMSVALPPFETRWTTVYCREAVSEGSLRNGI